MKIKLKWTEWRKCNRNKEERGRKWEREQKNEQSTNVEETEGVKNADKEDENGKTTETALNKRK